MESLTTGTLSKWQVIQVAGYPAYKSPTTYWVKAEEAEALEQLNKEMLEVLGKVSRYLDFQMLGSPEARMHNAILNEVKSIITKAEAQ